VSFFSVILVSGCVHATFCFRGGDILNVLTVFWLGFVWLFFFLSPNWKARLHALLLKQNIVRVMIVCFSNHASLLRLQLRKVFLHKFPFYYKLPSYVRNEGVYHSLHFFSDVSLSTFTYCKLLLRLCYHSNGCSSPAAPAFICYVLC